MQIDSIHAGFPPPLHIEIVLQGVRLSYYDSRADVLMMTLTTVIPDHFKTYMIGFDAAPSAVPEAAVGIHQPDGSYKSLSVAGSISTNFPPPAFPPDEVQPSSATHFQARPCAPAPPLL